MTGTNACHMPGTTYLIYYFFRTSEIIDDCIKMKGNMPSMRTVKKIVRTLRKEFQQSAHIFNVYWKRFNRKR